MATAFAHADVCIVNDDWTQWRELTAADFSGMRRKVVFDGRRILDRTAMEALELHVLDG